MKSQYLSALALLAGSATAHLDAFCTCTDPSAPGTLSFYLGTYHGAPGAGRSVPGQVHIQSPAGNVQSFNFNTFRSDGQRNQNNGPTMAAGLKSKWGMSGSTQCNCYGNNPSQNSAGVTDAQVMRPGGLQSLGCSSSTIETWYKATLNQASSGTYLVHTTGTDANLAPWGPGGSV